MKAIWRDLKLATALMTRKLGATSRPKYIARFDEASEHRPGELEKAKSSAPILSTRIRI